MDLGSTGYKYTWRDPLVFEKLNRGLSNDIWRTMILKAHVQVLHRLNYSDNHPILIRLMDRELRRKNKDFTLESVWLVEKFLETFLKNLWNNNVNLSKNLKNFREQATQWNLHNLERIHKEKNKLCIQKTDQGGGDHVGMRKMEKLLQSNLVNILYKK